MDLQASVRGEGLDYGQFEAAAQARDWFKRRIPKGSRVRVVGDDDCDGVTSAFVLTRALQRAGYEPEVAVMPVHDHADAKSAISGHFDAYVVADAGSVLLPVLDSFGPPVLVVDHHNAPAYEGRNVHEMNPRRVGGDRTWGVSASVVAGLFALAFDKKNADTAFAAAAGGVSDRQHLGGFHGLLAYIVDEGVRAGQVTRQTGFTLPGETLVETIAGSFDPYFAGFSGNAAATATFLHGLGLRPERDPADVPHAVATDLAARLDASLARAGRRAERHYPFFGERLPMRGRAGVPTLFSLCKMVEACTAASSHHTALALLAGEASAAHEALSVARQRQARLLAELARLRHIVEERPHLRMAQTTDAPDTGVYAHSLLTYVFGDDRPLVVWAKTPTGIKASIRGSPSLFLAGLDVSRAISVASRAVGGHGGGHPGAAGATIPTTAGPQFLELLERECARLAGAAA